jgi:hypothetical protein
LRVDFSAQDVASVATEARVRVEPRGQKPTTAAFVGKSGRDLLELLVKLLQLLDRPRDVGFLSSLIKREIIFRLITGGYESRSQFSREYRRRFGLPPRQDIQAMRASPETRASSD